MLVWILSAIAIFVFSVVLLGRAILSIINADMRVSTADSTAIGLIAVSSIFLLSALTGIDQKTTAHSLFFFSAGLIFYSSWRNYKKRGLALAVQFDQVGTIKIVFLLLIGLLAGASSLSHSLGYDDTAHLEYLIEVREGILFPTYRPLVGAWEVARYPLFGIVLSGLGSHTPGGTLFLYYFFGFVLLGAISLKIFNVLEERELSTSNVLGATSLIFGALALGLFDYDSFLNFASYPFQGARLLLILGSLYLFFDWPRQRTSRSLVIGHGLMLTGSFWHPNSAVIALIYLGIFFLLLLVGFPKPKTHLMLKLSLVCALVIILGVASPNAVVRKNLAFSNADVIVLDSSESASTSAVDIPTSGAGSLGISLEHLIGSLSDRYYSRVWPLTSYLKRIGWLFLVIPLLLFLVLRFRFLQQGSWYITIAGLTVATQLTLTLPKQVVGSIVKSGTYWMLADLTPLLKNLDIDQIIVTDSYTALYLNHLGFRNAEKLEYEDQVGLFSPISPPTLRKELASAISGTHGKTFLQNERYWRNPSRVTWPFSSWSTEVPQNHLTSTGIAYRGLDDVKDYVSRAFGALSATINMPVSSFSSIEGVANESENLFSELNSPIIYKDIAVVPLKSTDTESWYEISLQGEGYNIDLMSILTRDLRVAVVPSVNCGEPLTENPYAGLRTCLSWDEWIWLESITQSSEAKPLLWQLTSQYMRDHGKIRIFAPPLNQPVYLVLNLVNGRFGGLAEIKNVEITPIDCDFEVSPKSFGNAGTLQMATCGKERAFILFGNKNR